VLIVGGSGIEELEDYGVRYSLDGLRVEENGEIVWPCEDDDGELAWPSEENAGNLRVPRVEEDEIRFRLGFAWQKITRLWEEKICFRYWLTVESVISARY
jgi:hypothetical protein